MKKLLAFSFMIALTTLFVSNLKATDYKADDKLIDEMFSTATEKVNISFNDLKLFSSPTEVSAAAPSAPVALILDFFLGGLGVHRFYLGTEIMTGCAYPLTCGGLFGVVPLIDFVVLIINMDDISAFVNNPKFFMW